MSSDLITSDGDAPAAAATEVELLLFQIGDSVYGADASSIRRIDRPGPLAIELPELGTLREGARALVFMTEAGEAELRVDLVRGVIPALIEDLRRLPKVARAHSFAVGMWLGREQPVLLIDLPETARVSPT